MSTTSESELAADAPSLSLLPRPAYFLSWQSLRDAFCLGLMVLGGLGYEHFLRRYLGGTPVRMQLSFGFTCSLLFALWYEFKLGDRRGSLVRMTAVTLVFMVGAYLAPMARAEYFVMMAEARNKAQVVAVFTAEGLALLSNPMAGFGGCLALSVMAARLLGGRLVVRTLSRVVQHDATTYSCPHCQGAIPR